MDTATAIASSQDRWGIVAPSQPLLPSRDAAADFFENAPDDSVVEIHEELFLRQNASSWINLQDLDGGSGYYQSLGYSTYRAQTMVERYADSKVRVVRVGAAAPF